MKDYSNYHGLNDHEKLTHDGLLLLQKSLNGFEGYDALINDTVEAKVLMYQKWDANSETKKVIGHISDIVQGNILKIDGLNWLITTFPEDNKVYRKAEMKLCNALFPITSDKIPDLLRDENGNLIRDDYGRPIPIESGGEKKLEPCVVETRPALSQQTEQIRLPEDKILVTLRYQESKSLQINSEFDMYNSRFRIIFTDFSKVINGVGVMTLTGERLVN
ncbi:hypothetical protein [Cytobacillus gottheilii]|uniref:hypothetical protein n=1 Tax=Cytobacillus gottheilii TaxID=859144 RepID=UPI0009BB381C|nr:hypothetical protein [Cytobacillus gottheilii]